MRPQNEIVNDEHDFDNHAKKVFIVGGELSVDNATVNVGDVGLKDTTETTINPATSDNQTNGKQLIRIADSPNLDSFGRFRTSELIAQLDVKMFHDKEPLFIDEVINGTASATFSNSTVIMTTSASNDYVIRQTKQRGSYRSGQGHLIVLTFDDFNLQTNIIKRIGYFTSSVVAPYTANFDGIYLESSDKIYACIGNNGTIEKVEQANWNLDKLDGTGISGITIDWSKSQILVIDFQWLAVGRVRMAVDVAGCIIPFHEFNHANEISGVYMRSPNKPIRWEIRQTGVGSGTFTHICGSIASEGGNNSLGVLRHIDSNTISSLASGTKYAILGIRLNSAHLDDIIDLQSISMITTAANDYVHWELIFNPTIAGTFTYASQSNSAVEIATGAVTNTVTGGTEIDGGYFSTSLPITTAVPNALKLGHKIDGTVDTIVLVAKPITNNVSVAGSLTWREQR